jgi:hypothetical protein
MGLIARYECDRGCGFFKNGPANVGGPCRRSGCGGTVVEVEYVPASDLRGAVEALRKYGVHRPDCAARRANWKADQPASCDCGLDAATGGQ